MLKINNEIIHTIKHNNKLLRYIQHNGIRSEFIRRQPIPDGSYRLLTIYTTDDDIITIYRKPYDSTYYDIYYVKNSDPDTLVYMCRTFVNGPNYVNIVPRAYHINNKILLFYNTSQGVTKYRIYDEYMNQIGIDITYSSYNTSRPPTIFQRGNEIACLSTSSYISNTTGINELFKINIDTGLKSGPYYSATYAYGVEYTAKYFVPTSDPSIYLAIGYKRSIAKYVISKYNISTMTNGTMLSNIFIPNEYYVYAYTYGTPNINYQSTSLPMTFNSNVAIKPYPESNSSTYLTGVGILNTSTLLPELTIYNPSLYPFLRVVSWSDNLLITMNTTYTSSTNYTIKYYLYDFNGGSNNEIDFTTPAGNAPRILKIYYNELNQLCVQYYQMDNDIVYGETILKNNLTTISEKNITLGTISELFQYNSITYMFPYLNIGNEKYLDLYIKDIQPVFYYIPISTYT